MKVNHINYPDRNGDIYCRRLNKVIELTNDAWDDCFDCPHFNGSYQGSGVECLWNDPDVDTPVWKPDNPTKEHLRVSKLLDSKK